jgi:hypothetical protein
LVLVTTLTMTHLILIESIKVFWVLFSRAVRSVAYTCRLLQCKKLTLPFRHVFTPPVCTTELNIILMRWRWRIWDDEENNYKRTKTKWNKRDRKINMMKRHSRKRTENNKDDEKTKGTIGGMSDWGTTGKRKEDYQKQLDKTVMRWKRMRWVLQGWEDGNVTCCTHFVCKCWGHLGHQDTASPSGKVYSPSPTNLSRFAQ